MNNSQRIRTEVGVETDKHIKVKLEQGTSFLEILSLTIDQKDSFPFYNCDYGVLVGRAVANGGVGIPNAKVSIFIPVDDDDKLREEIMAIYPYEKARDKNADGKRYNLLPRVSTTNKDGIVTPKQPFGSLPIKEEFITNDTWLEVYEKYYKYTTVTNSAGDYMLYGVPVGIQVVHMSVDITDIGRFSMTPFTMVTNLGYSSNLFTTDNKVKPKDDLDDLPHIETQEISIDVIPFCGDNINFNIGITRQDFRLRAEIVSTFTVFGTAFTDGDSSFWGEETDSLSKNIRELYRARHDANNTVSIGINRIDKVTEQVFYYLPIVSDSDIQNGNVNTETDIVFMLNSQYTSFKSNGDFVYIIPCTRKKIITDEFGQDVDVPEDSSVGVFIEFSGFFTLEISNETIPMNFSGAIGTNNGQILPIRHRYKFPQKATSYGTSFTSDDNNINTSDWKKQYYTFESGKVYSIAKFNGCVYNDSETSNSPGYNANGFYNSDLINNLAAPDSFWNTGILYVADLGDNTNAIEEFPANNGTSRFGGNWINFCVYFMQNSKMTDQASNVDGTRSNNNFTQQSQNMSEHFYLNNLQTIAAGIPNTKWFGRSDLHWTDFIEVPKDDILAINKNSTTKGFKKNELVSLTLIGNEYKNGESDTPQYGGKIDGNPSLGTDTETYFYKGLKESNCIKLIIDLGLI